MRDGGDEVESLGSVDWGVLVAMGKDIGMVWLRMFPEWAFGKQGSWSGDRCMGTCPTDR